MKTLGWENFEARDDVKASWSCHLPTVSKQALFFPSQVFSLWSGNNSKLANSGVSVRTQGEITGKSREKKYATLTCHREM